MKDHHSWVKIHDPDVLGHSARPPKTFYVIWGKRLFDIVCSAVALVFLSPIIALVWLIISAEGGKGFYGQERIGMGRRAFKCWKLRSMVVDAEACLQEHLKNNSIAEAEWVKNRKLTKDPRITPLGQFIRKTSIDELPQLWNVLIGDMSIVGPRPVVFEELHMYGVAQESYLAIRPGITGLWQVNGRNSVSYESRVAFDTKYCGSITFGGDIILILKTLLVVIKRTGQ